MQRRMQDNEKDSSAISSSVFREQLVLLAQILAVAVLTGLSVALFLWLLDMVTSFRHGHQYLVFALPIAGVLISVLYSRAPADASAGNDLIISQVHETNKKVPLVLAPLILVTTLITHLFGGSAGREGTAVQMGGGIAAWFSQNPLLLSCGMAAGFGAVFGTPWAGAVFAVEVITCGRIKYQWLIHCLLASFAADQVCRLTGIAHTDYQLTFSPSGRGQFSFITNDLVLPLQTIAAGIIFGYTSMLFSYGSHYAKQLSLKITTADWQRPVIGGLLVIAISYGISSMDYMGLGVSNPDPGGVSILSAVREGGAENFSWFWKLLLTAITLGFGFKGGEVTPLFFIGATMGNVLTAYTGAPVDLFAALGFIAVFAGATNTPLACTLMGVELFGPSNTIFFALACFTAYFFSGRKGIYSSQRYL